MKIKHSLLALACMLALVLTAFTMPSLANATEGDDETPVECVPEDAWTEYIEHPAETHIEKVLVDPGSPAVPGVDEIWANFSPNKQEGPFDGPPSWPSDERGTWQIHNKIPGGHVGPDGVYQKGNGNASWFYRVAGVEAIPEVPATYEDKVIVDKEAWIEVIEHPAVTCPPTEEPCPDDSLIQNPDTGECEPTEPTDPTDEPTDPTDEPTDPTDEPTNECKGRPVVGGPCAPQEWEHPNPDTVCETEPGRCDPTQLGGPPIIIPAQPAPANEPAGLPNTGA